MSSDQRAKNSDKKKDILNQLSIIVEAETGDQFNLSEADLEKNLREELGFDSVDLVSVVSNAERHYKIRLTQEELGELITVGDVVNTIFAKTAAQEADKPMADRSEQPIRQIRRT